MTRLLRSSDKIDITQYLPPFLKKDPHFRAVCEACSWEHENIRNAILDALNQFFVEKATWGLSMWERVLDLHPSPEDTYDVNEHFSQKEIEQLNAFYANQFDCVFEKKGKYNLLKGVSYL